MIGLRRGSHHRDHVDEQRLIQALDEQLDAISNDRRNAASPRPSTPAYAYVRELDRVILVDWMDRRVPRALRRISFVNALHLEQARRATVS